MRPTLSWSLSPFQFPFGWLVGPVKLRDVWRSSTEVAGVLCVVVAGTCVTPQWSVVKWATSRQQLSWGLHGLVQAVVPSCSVNCPALATRASSLSVVMATVVDSTAATMKMSALCVKVSQCYWGGYYLHLLCVCFCMHWPHKTQWLYDCKRYTFCLSPGPLVSIRCCAQRAGGLTACATGRPAEATFTGEACVVHSTLSFTSLWSLLSRDTAGCPNLLMCMCALWNVASLLCVCVQCTKVYSGHMQ